MRSFMKGVYAFLIMLGSIFLIIGLLAFTTLIAPMNMLGEDGQVVYEVKSGWGAKYIIKDLEKEGLIKSATSTYLFEKLIGDATFKAGTYVIEKKMSAPTLIKYLSDESNSFQDEVTLTFREGIWLKEIAGFIEEYTNLSASELLSYWKNADVYREMKEDYTFLGDEPLNNSVRYYFEGYLFPDTYRFLEMTTCEQVTRKFLDRTQEIYDEYAEEIEESGYTPYEVFTLASMVQFEGNTMESMEKIASVFFNRLNAGEKLRSSVTVCYAIDQTGTACELESNRNYDSPYNTYIYKGLPPGPIVNPGTSAIEAVLRPANTDYMFFLADICGDGTVYFSRTLAEHEALSAKFLTCY